MKRAWDWVKGWFVEKYRDDDYADDYDDYDYDDEQDYYESGKRANASTSDFGETKITAIHKSVTTRVTRVSPKDIEEAEAICKLIKENVLVVVNLAVKEQGEKETNQRIADFICGIVWALEGDMRRPDENNNNLFLVGSQHVIFEWDDDESLKRNVYKEMKSSNYSTGRY